jgi:hypothetical protein
VVFLSLPAQKNIWTDSKVQSLPSISFQIHLTLECKELKAQAMTYTYHIGIQMNPVIAQKET